MILNYGQAKSLSIALYGRRVREFDFVRCEV
jgi:hypothetical protein